MTNKQKYKGNGNITYIYFEYKNIYIFMYIII